MLQIVSHRVLDDALYAFSEEYRKIFENPPHCECLCRQDYVNYLNAALMSDDGQVLSANIDNIVMGLLVAKPLHLHYDVDSNNIIDEEKYHRGLIIRGYLENIYNNCLHQVDLVVSRSMHNVGIGPLLINKSIELAPKKYKYITGVVDSKNKIMRQLLMRMEFKETEISWIIKNGDNKNRKILVIKDRD